MATTTNYGWETPDDTDLVKDGALAQRTTASAIDSSLFSITNGKNVGLVHINTTSFTTQANVSISNVFNSSFDNYKIELQIDVSTTNYPLIKLRDAGGDVSLANYAFRNLSLNSSSTSSDTSALGRTQGAAQLTAGGIGINYGGTIELIAPNLSKPTMATGNGTVQVGNMELLAFAYNANTQMTGISFLSSAGTMTGSIRIYGYRNS